MIKCYFIDIKDISSNLPKSNFVESELDQLANLILATDGLIRPLILKKSGKTKYKIIEGHREYYAVLKAKAKDNSNLEMVNAFVIDPNIHSAAVDQLKLLKEDVAPVTASDPMPSGIDQLLPTVLAAISEQMKPLVAQLAEQKQMLETLMIDQIASTTDKSAILTSISEQIQPLGIQLTEQKQMLEALIRDRITPIVVNPKPPKVSKSKIEKVSQQTSKTTTASKNIQPTLTDPITVKTKTPRTPKATTIKSTKVATLPESIDPTKATNTLNLINTFSQNELEFAMQRSGLTKTVTNLVPSIIASRDSQPNQKFDTWETILSIKIKGLTNAVVKSIIEKLK